MGSGGRKGEGREGNLESSGDTAETLVPLETVDTLTGKAVVLNESSGEIL